MFKKLFEGVDGLSEELIARMQPMFEAAVYEKSESVINQLKEAHAAEIEDLREQLAESAAVNIEERTHLMAKKLDVFLERVVGEWMNENSERVQGIAINEASAVFLTQIAEAAKNFNAIIPDSDRDIVDDMNSKIVKMECRLNDALRENMSLRESEMRVKKLVLAGKVARGMSEVGKSRLRESALSFTYKNPKQFRALLESHRMIIEGDNPFSMDEDDLFDDGVEKKSRQGRNGSMVDEEFVDGTDDSYPLNITEDDDEDEDDEIYEGKKAKRKMKKESDDGDEDDEEIFEGKKSKKKVREEEEDDFFNDEDDDEEMYEGKKTKRKMKKESDDEDEEKNVNESVDLNVFKGLVR